jgi:hypothetical protein
MRKMVFAHKGTEFTEGLFLFSIYDFVVKNLLVTAKQ